MTKEMYEAALSYVRQGMLVYPVYGPNVEISKWGKPIPEKNRGKQPMDKNWQIFDELPSEEELQKWFENTDHNIGLQCGRNSDIMVIDFDKDTFIDVIFPDGIPNTRQSYRTEGRGHLYFKHTDKLTSHKEHDLGIEILSDSLDEESKTFVGNNVVMPPSIHRSGDVYKWKNPNAPILELDDSTIQRINELIKTWHELVSYFTQCRTCFHTIYDDEDVDWYNRDLVIAVGTDLKRVGASLIHYQMFARMVYKKEYDRSLTISDFKGFDKKKTWTCETLREKIPTYFTNEKCEKCKLRKADDTTGSAYHRTDLGNAMRLATMFKDDIRFCYPWNSWLNWNGKLWERDRSAEIERYARRVIDDLYREALEYRDKDNRQDALDYAMGCESKSSIMNMIRLAQSERGIPILPEALDTDKWLFNVQNGTINLRTGELNSHTKNNFITKISPVTYDPKATCPTWLAFLDKIFQGNENIIEYMQRKAGYCLTGDTREEDFDVFYGATGSNGKSKYTGAIVYIMGEYHKHAKIETIQQAAKHDGSSASSDVASLCGARLVTVSEPGQGFQLNESRIKDFTGRDPITARHLYQEEFTFIPEFKLWIYTNYKPVIKGHDGGIWRRPKLVPFDVYIPPEERDKEMGEKLQAEASGILNWMIEGCRKWQEDGLKVPVEIEVATEEWHEEMDRYGAFLRDFCQIGAGDKFKVYSLPLWNLYCLWCYMHDYDSDTQITFNRNIFKRGFKRLKKDENGVGIGGLTISDDLLKTLVMDESGLRALTPDDFPDLTVGLENSSYTPAYNTLSEKPSKSSKSSGLPLPTILSKPDNNNKMTKNRQDCQNHSLNSSGNEGKPDIHHDDNQEKCGICNKPLNGNSENFGHGVGKIHPSCKFELIRVRATSKVLFKGGVYGDTNCTLEVGEIREIPIYVAIPLIREKKVVEIKDFEN